jgi:hypothetical protein
VTTAQSNLTLPGNVLEGGASKEYSHVIGDPVYDGLIKILTGSRLADFDEYVLHHEMVSRLSILKHHIAHLFTPIDVDIQGLIESKFRPDYWEKVVAAYRATKPTRVITGARRIKEELGKIANNKQKKLIDKKWKEAEKEFDNMKPLLTALGDGDLTECIKQADGFRTSLGKFLRILDELDDELRALDERKK